jgi:S1-C subfamily serine protease
LITTNIIQRTFHIQVGDSTGTCFTVDVNGNQYLVTAKHVVKDLNGTCNIRIFHENQWKDIQVIVVGHCKGDIDISVLTAQLQLSPAFPLEPTSEGMIYGQDVYFLGFPYGMTGEVGALNRDFPLPFVKKAVISCMYTTDNGTKMFFLDGQNNPGFSGGPVVFKEQNKNDYKVTSVISGFRYTEEPVYQGDNKVPLAYRYNTGIIISYGIKHAVDLIESNPIGFKLEA